MCDLTESYRPFSGDRGIAAFICLNQSSLALRQCLNGPRKPVVCHNLISDARAETHEVPDSELQDVCQAVQRLRQAYAPAQSDMCNLAALSVLGAEDLQGAAVETVMASLLVFVSLEMDKIFSD